MRRNIIPTIMQMSFTWKKRAVGQGAGSAAYSIIRVDGRRRALEREGRFPVSGRDEARESYCY